MTKGLYSESTQPATAARAPTGFPLPKVCGIEGCGRKPQVVLVLVRDGANERRGAASEFGAMSGNLWQPRGRFEFLSWVSRCGVHYALDLEAEGRQSLSVADFAHKLTPAKLAEAKAMLRELGVPLPSDDLLLGVKR